MSFSNAWDTNSKDPRATRLLGSAHAVLGVSNKSEFVVTDPVNLLDLIRKHFGNQKWAGSYMPNPTSRIQFGSIFPKKTWIILCKTDSDLTWMAWSCIGQTYMVWKHRGVQESLGLVFGRKQPAHYQFSTVRLGCVLPQMSQIILYKTSLDLIWFWLTASCFGKQIRSGDKAVCKNHQDHFWPMLPIWPGLEWMWIRSSMFTGEPTIEPILDNAGEQ